MTLLSIEQKNSLCATIRTTKYSRKIVALIRDAASSLYKINDKDYKEQLKLFLDDEIIQVLNNILKDMDSSNKMEIEEKLKEIILFLKEVEEITFTIPVHPSKEFTDKLFNWCSQNIQGDILLEFITNRAMDSGFLMVYKGHYFEYTLENLLDEYFISHNVGNYFVRDMQ